MKYYFSLLIVVVVAVAGCKGLCNKGPCGPDPSCEPCGPGPCVSGSCDSGSCNSGSCALGGGLKGLFGKSKNLPPAQMMMHPGPGVGGPGPGVMAVGPAMMAPGQPSQVAFVGPDGMVVKWDVSMAGQFDSEPLVCPGRYNFNQAAIYRLKLNNVPSRPGVELYPTLEIGPAVPRTGAFLSHNAIPVQFTEEDFDQVLSGNFVTKVIYLPDPDFQELASAGIETLVSTRLDPGVDPIAEADKRGAILAVVRLGNKDLEMPGDPDGNGGVVPASYGAPYPGAPYPDAPMQPGPVGQMGAQMGPPMGMATGNGWATVPQPYISGVTGPAYGMTTCGTPIGLPGPPHIPLGIPAGLRKHTITNHTRVNMPKPTEKIRINVKQVPGMSYPKPASRVRIVERTRPGAPAPRDCQQQYEVIVPGCPDASCPVPCEGPCEDAPLEGGL